MLDSMTLTIKVRFLTHILDRSNDFISRSGKWILLKYDLVVILFMKNQGLKKT
jgi:hypothetical protein